MAKRHVYGVVKNGRSGCLMGDLIIIDVPNDDAYRDWLTLSIGYARSRGYDCMLPPSFWRSLLKTRRGAHAMTMTIGGPLGVQVMLNP